MAKAQELRERLAGQQAGLQQQHAQMQERLQQAEQQWQQALADSEFADETAFAAALLDDALRRELQQRKEQLQQRQVEAAALLAQATQTLEQHRQNRPEGTDEANADLDALTQSLAELAQQLKALQLSQGELRNQLESDAARRLNQQALFEQIARSQQDYDDWSYLNQLIGSKEGDKFRRFAQGLTLDHLVYLANLQLGRLHGRYLLQRKTSDALELQVVDTAGRRAARYPYPVRRRELPGQPGAGAGVVRSGQPQNQHRLAVPRRRLRHAGRRNPRYRAGRTGQPECFR